MGKTIVDDKLLRAELALFANSYGINSTAGVLAVEQAKWTDIKIDGLSFYLKGFIEMQCREFEEIVDSYLKDELSVETNHDLLKHLEACAACRTELAARRETRAQLRLAFDAAPEFQLRPEFTFQLRNHLKAEALGIPVASRNLFAFMSKRTTRRTKRTALSPARTASAIMSPASTRSATASSSFRIYRKPITCCERERDGSVNHATHLPR